MKRGPFRYLLLAAVALGLLTLAVPASAIAGTAGTARTAVSTPSALAGFTAFADSINENYDSAGGKVTVTAGSTGQYTVTFGKLGGITSGHAEITSLSTRDTCAVGGWSPSGADLNVSVLCYDTTGAPASGSFSLLVTQPRHTARGLIAFDRIQNPAKSQTLTGKYQYNSTGRHNSVRHLSTGRYQVTIPGIGKNTGTGTVKVSAFGAGGGACQLSSWSGIKGSVVSHVDCYAADGSRQNRKFDIEYVRNNNLLGINSLVTANAFATKPTGELYQPSIQYDSQPRARVSVAALFPGQYVSLFVGSNGRPGNSNGGGGNVQFTPVSSKYVLCDAGEWLDGTTPYDVPGCVDHNGKFTAIKFDIQWAVNR